MFEFARFIVRHKVGAVAVVVFALVFLAPNHRQQADHQQQVNATRDGAQHAQARARVAEDRLSAGEASDPGPSGGHP